MKIEKLPSGSYRIRKMYKGKTYTVTTEYKPTQKEAIKLLSDAMENERICTEHMTFLQAAQKYTEMKSNVLSPRTIREYEKMPNRFSDSFCNTLISDITREIIQKEINLISKDRSPKTVRDYHGFISAVLGAYRPDFKISTTLPQKVKKQPYIPSDEDVKKILKYAEGTEYEVPIMLACYGLRRSEICALSIDDIEGDKIRISKALVQDKDNDWVLKTTKTTSSTRTVIVPAKITDRIKEQGYIFKGKPGSITHFLNRAQLQLGMPHFSIHKLRHYFASKMSALNIPEEDILKMGGWGTDHVMKTVYRHAMEDKENQAQRDAANKLGEMIF